MSRGAKIAAGFICIGLVSWALEGQSEVGYFRDLVFKAEGRPPIRALSAYRASASGAMTRLMVVTPSGRAVVLTDTLLPRQGIVTTRILDDLTGTWLEIELRFDRGDTLNQFFAANDSPQLEPFPFVLRTSNGRSWVGRSSPPDGQGSYSVAVPGLRADLHGLSTELAPGFSAGLAFLLATLPEEENMLELTAVPLTFMQSRGGVEEEYPLGWGQVV